MAWSLARAKQEMTRWVGTKESPPRSDNVHFTRWYGAQTLWCQIAVNYILVKAGLPPPGRGRKGSACTVECAKWYNDRGKFSKTRFKPGCTVYFDLPGPSRCGGGWLGINHVGIGLAERPTEVLCWEGNRSNQVMLGWRDKRLIVGYGYNDWGRAHGDGNPEADLAMGMLPGVLGQGPRGDAHVKQVQHRLNQIGNRRHRVLGGRALDEDGVFGPDTRKVLIDFQTHRPWLTADGTVGRDDWTALRYRIAPTAARFPGHVHKRGPGIDVHVKLIQLRLNDIGNNRHSSLGGRALAVDGEFGADTHRVVADFQRHRGLEPNGVVDQRTWARLWTKR